MSTVGSDPSATRPGDSSVTGATTSSGTTTGSASTPDDDDDTNSTVPEGNTVVTPPVVTDDEADRDANRRSGLQDSDTSPAGSNDTNSAAATFGATSTVQGGDITGLGATNNGASGGDTNVATVTDTDTATLVVDLPLDTRDVTPSGDPVPSLTAIDLESGQLLDVDLSTNGPVAPPLPGVLLGGLDQALSLIHI